MSAACRLLLCLVAHQALSLHLCVSLRFAAPHHPLAAGYHRLFAHRSYKATKSLSIGLMLAGTAAVEGSLRWWARDHRAHHKYVDTDRDPYSAVKGFWYAHVGWMLVKQDADKIGRVSIKDLNEDPIVRFQHRYYLPLAAVMGLLVPTIVCGLLWGDWKGGYFIAGVARLVFVHHSTFFVNSLAHFAGAADYSDAHTARNSWITALLTLGEGNHNFHHERPDDYRNGIKWCVSDGSTSCSAAAGTVAGGACAAALTCCISLSVRLPLPVQPSLCPSFALSLCASLFLCRYEYDPTKLFIKAMSLLGLAYDLKTYDDNEIAKGVLQMTQKRLEGEKRRLDWGPNPAALPAMDRDAFDARAKAGLSAWLAAGAAARTNTTAEGSPAGVAAGGRIAGSELLVAIDGFVLDLAPFAASHPGGEGYITAFVGKDATVSHYHDVMRVACAWGHAAGPSAAITVAKALIHFPTCSFTTFFHSLTCPSCPSCPSCILTPAAGVPRRRVQALRLRPQPAGHVPHRPPGRPRSGAAGGGGRGAGGGEGGARRCGSGGGEGGPGGAPGCTGGWRCGRQGGVARSARSVSSTVRLFQCRRNSSCSPVARLAMRERGAAAIMMIIMIVSVLR